MKEDQAGANSPGLSGGTREPWFANPWTNQEKAAREDRALGSCS